MNTTSTPKKRRPKIVIVGGGFAGQAVARELRRAHVDILLIDKNNYLTFQPLLYQVATAALEPEEIAYPIRRAFQNQKNVRFRHGSVTGVDWKRRRLLLAGQNPVEFDYLVLAAGSTPNYFNIPGADVHCFPLKHLSEAVELRSHILRLFEQADRDPSLIKKGILNVVVIGGGPTGVEMAGALHELFYKTLHKDYPNLPVEQARIVLVEAGESLLAPFTPESRKHAHETLAERGVHVACNEKVVKVTEKAVFLESKRGIQTATPIWAVGVRASPLGDLLGLEQTRGGRIVVKEDLSVPGQPNVFVVGDMAGSRSAESTLHPQLASVARQSGKHAGRQILQRLRNAETTPFVYKSPGTMATIGRHSAVAEFPGDIRLEGFAAWFTWLSLHLMLLSGFRNRLHVLISWLGNYFTNDRTSRLIIEPAQDQPAPAAHPVRPTQPRPTVSEKIQTGLPTTKPAMQINDPLQRIRLLLDHADMETLPERIAQHTGVSSSRAA